MPATSRSAAASEAGSIAVACDCLSRLSVALARHIDPAQATVASSGTDATSASSSTTKLVAPPVLMISREVNARPAMVSSGSANPVRP